MFVPYPTKYFKVNVEDSCILWSDNTSPTFGSLPYIFKLLSVYFSLTLIRDHTFRL